MAKKKVKPKPKKIEGHNGWSRWDGNLRFEPNSCSLDCNSQSLLFCGMRRHRRCEREGKCSEPPIYNPPDREALLEENGVKPRGRAYIGTSDRTKKENRDIERDWREVDKIRKRHLKECRPIHVEMTER